MPTMLNMDNLTQIPLQVFDPGASVAIVERKLPHWLQAGTICFITWRTLDSLPQSVLDSWFADRARWLHRHGINAADPSWRSALEKLDRESVAEFLQIFWNRWHDALDECSGECVLRQSELADEVAKSLTHFDGNRYLLLDYVVMPNHVHLLASFASEDAMLGQCESWKHYTAKQINCKLGRRGRFWQQDGFDHLVRSEEQFEFLRRYIASNPTRARLRAGEYLHYARP